MAKGRQQYFADEVSIQKEAREFAIEEELKAKIDSVEEGAQVNVIETVKVNGDPLVPDENKAVDVDVPLVEDNLYSVDTEAALSARQGKVLYEYIQNLQSRGRFLSNWNCATGLPTTNPYDSPYEYRAGDYYLVSNVSSGTNYRPEGTEYIIGQASLTVESEEVKVSDMYIYDGTAWLLILNTERPIAIDDALSPTSVNPVENRVVTQTFGTKQDIIPDLATIRAGAALGDTSVQPGDSLSVLSGTSDDISEGSSHLFMTTQERAKLGNQSGINTGDETKATIEAKLQAASASNNGYLSSTDWATFNDKENAIADLQDIRSNAQAGKNASDTIATYGNIVTHNMNEFATAAQGALAEQALQSGDNVSDLVNDAGYITDAYHDDTKQDVLTAGDNITIENKCESDMKGPCPSGFHIPKVAEWQSLADICTALNLSQRSPAAAARSILKFPTYYCFIRDNGERYYGGGGSFYQRYLCSDEGSTYFFFDSDWYFTIRTDAAHRAWSIRPFKNTPVAPDNSWTMVFDGSAVATGAGIFYNSSDGIFSLSSDGTTRLTIADKNCGATEVYNTGDTQTSANCGLIYERGNNHGFEEGETITTTNVASDVTGYGPGNYFSRDKWYNDGNSTHRGYSGDSGNLWGGVTQGTRCQEVISATDTTYQASDFDIKDLADSTGLRTTWSGKQDALTLGSNLSWGTNGELNATDTTYTAGPGISISNNNVISNTQTSAEWGNITGTLSDQTDLQDALDEKQDVLTAGENITIGEVCESDMKGPAPDGFHVPLNTEWQAVKDIRVALGGGSSDGTNFEIALKLPFAGDRNHSSASIYSQGSYGYYWSSSRSDADNAYYLLFYSTAINPQNTYLRANGHSVRCFKNSPVVPTSSWTKLYGTSIEAGGIFWSSTDGLISLSSDGNTWITIADKNLGATQVWNSGDTLSETNAGKYYQRGNNYGFPFTGTIANQSTTQVDASNYGPGNYYSSDTFIKNSGRWDSTDNGNLWGGVTQGQQCALEISAQVPDSAQWGNITGTLSDQTDLQTALNAKADATDINTKTFYLSSTSDLTNAQAAYDWYLAGKTPIIGWNGGTFILSRYDAPNMSGALLKFREGYRKITGVWDNKYTAIGDGYVIRFVGSNNTVSQIDIGESMNYSYGYLSPSIDYSNPYTPEYAGSPATKKYVDDAVAGITPGQTYTAGNGINIDQNNEISVDTSVVATQTDLTSKQDTLTAGTGINIDANNVISATITPGQTYTAGAGINIDANNEISNTLPGPTIAATAPTGTEGALWYDTTNDVLMAYNGTAWKEAGTQMKVLSYGHSTWQDFIDAYNENAVVYCKASSQSNPGSGAQGRMAFMAFIDINSSTQAIQGVEFQYYRSRSSHSTAATVLDEVYIYKLTPSNGGTWTVTQRDTAAEPIAGTGIGLTYNASGMTISNTGVTSFNGDTGAITLTPGTYLSLSNNVIDVDTSLIATKADLANFAGFLVVAQLPTTDIKTNIIYLLGPVGTGADKYEEYIYSNNNWVMIGDTTIDLSPYFHKTNDDSDDIIEGSTNLFLTSAERTILGNTSGTNSGDETKTTIQTKLGAASSSNSGYLTSTDYDTLMAKADPSDVNVKTFYLQSTSDTTTAQEAIDWIRAGNTAILKLKVGSQDYYYYYSYADWSMTSVYHFVRTDNLLVGAADGASTSHQKYSVLNISVDMTQSTPTVSSIYSGDTTQENFEVLRTGYNYPTPYTPQYNGSPATKKYVDDSVASAGDMFYEDFEWNDNTGATVTLDLNTIVEPVANFTINAPSTIKDGQTYTLRAENGATAYTMTLGTNITNPYSTSTTLTANGIDQFVFLAIDGKLELQPSLSKDVVVSSQANNILTSGMKVWAGTEADYGALTSYDSNTVYLTI